MASIVSNINQQDIVVIKNTKYPDKPDLIKDKFYNYNIYHACIDNVEMYAVNEILRQYAKEHNKSRIRLNDYLRLESTKRYINVLCKAHDNIHDSGNIQNIHNDSDLGHCEENKDLPTNNKNIDKIMNKDNFQNNPNNFQILEVDGHNSQLQESNKQLDNNRNIANLQNNQEKKYIDDKISEKFDNKQGIIIKFSYDGYGFINTSYTVMMCEKLLTHCLMWLDMEFANTIYDFLMKLRSQDNDYLKKNLEIVELEKSELKLMNEKQAQLISEVNTKCNELSEINSKLESNLNDLESVNTELESKNKDLESINTELESKNKDLNNVISDLESKNKELNEINSCIDKAKKDLESLVETQQKYISKLEPRQVRDTYKTNWILYFHKRMIVRKNDQIYILVSFGYRNNKRFKKSIRDTMLYSIENIPNGQVARQDMTTLIYQSMMSCNGVKFESNGYRNTLIFKLTDFCDSEDIGFTMLDIIEALQYQNQKLRYEELKDIMVKIQPCQKILDTLNIVYDKIINNNTWFESYVS